MVNVKFLPKHHIEWNAEQLLAGYGERFGPVTEPPVPVEEILETHLNLTLEFDDLSNRLGYPDIIGALWAPDRLVGIDERLDPTVNPRMLGRFRYTVGHEIGHWEQHRNYFLDNPNQKDMFPDLVIQPSVICRVSEAKQSIEFQADHFSACLLMPRQMVLTWWQQTGIPPFLAEGGTLKQDLLDDVVAGLARDFQVSKQAMRIRLDELNVLPAAPGPLFSGSVGARFS